MSEKEEKVNIVIGEALLSLLESEEDVSQGLLTDRLQRVLEAETDDDRRNTIIDAIRQINRLSGWGENHDAPLHRLAPEQAEQAFRPSRTLH